MWTYLLWKAAADAGHALTYADLIRRARQELRAAGYDQVPQLEGAAELLKQRAFAPLGVSAV